MINCCRLASLDQFINCPLFHESEHQTTKIVRIDVVEVRLHFRDRVGFQVILDYVVINSVLCYCNFRIQETLCNLPISILMAVAVLHYLYHFVDFFSICSAYLSWHFLYLQFFLPIKFILTLGNSLKKVQELIVAGQDGFLNCNNKRYLYDKVSISNLMFRIEE